MPLLGGILMFSVNQCWMNSNFKGGLRVLYYYLHPLLFFRIGLDCLCQQLF